MDKIFLIFFAVAALFVLPMSTLHAEPRSGQSCVSADVYTYKMEQEEKRILRNLKNFYRKEDKGRVCREIDGSCQKICKNMATKCFAGECTRQDQNKCYKRLENCLSRCAMREAPCAEGEGPQEDGVIDAPAEPEESVNDAPSIRIH